ncbi:MAG: putative DNA binding domain-containing protein [Clostridiales bacterium]|nr:putative DNA binding domain-containing protein [Clostridiales bacterium]
MTREKLDEMLQGGEGFTVEYKECVNGLNNSVFETVCSFSNRYGGYILLGVQEVDHKGIVIGVNPRCVTDMKKNFVNMLNNPQKMHPSLYLNLEELEYDGKLVLWVYVPVSSQIEFCDRKIFDRNEDADQDVSISVDLVVNISNRKSSTYIERKIFPYADMDDLCIELIGKARQMAVNRNREHPWRNMDDTELLKSAGLYEKNRVTGEEGLNMACILLFGKAEVIQSCVPGYKTDAIYRVKNMDRYDDRLIVENNLIESYDILMQFISKHTDDRFFLIDNVNVSVRSAIAREIVSNILVHRDFGSAFPAKLIIEKDKIYTENWNRTQRIGKLELEDFTPYPKNPILAKFFINIGYADGLGSGVRNLYKFTKIYSGGEPDLEEGDVFRLTVPLVAGVSDNYTDVIAGSAIEGRNSAIGSADSAIETADSAIGAAGSAIDGRKRANDVKRLTIACDPRILDMINSAIENNNYGGSTKDKMNQICYSIEKGQIFGTSDIAQIAGCSPSTAREILRKFRKMGVIREVKGKGKGRYIFIS